MISKVIKRDGRKVNFNVDRIARSINRAANSIGGQDYSKSEELANKIYEELEKSQVDKYVTSQLIQDMIKKVLHQEGFEETLNAYSSYSDERNRTREKNLDITNVYRDLTFEDSKDSNVKRENANIKPEHSKAHKDGDIHIHDLDFLTLTTTCCQIDLIKLFKDGFCTGEGFLREPQSIASYAALAAIAIQSNQNDQHGGQSIPNFEYAMAKGVRVSYKKEYLKNLSKAIELLTDTKEPESRVHCKIYKIR